MFLHIGQDVIINQKDILGIFDMDTATVSKHTRDLLKEAEKKGEVITVTCELPKSFIICTENRERRIYLSQLSTATLLKRTATIEYLS